MTEKGATAQIHGDGDVNVTNKEKHSEPETYISGTCFTYIYILQYITEFIVPVTKFLY